MSSPICCVIGTGSIGTHHASSIVDAFGSVFVVDPNAGDIHGAKMYSSLSSIQNQKIDAFVISTTSKLHFRYINEISKIYGDPLIIVEKPLFYSEQEYSEFKNLKNGNVYCNVPYFGHPELEKIKKNFDLGSPRFVKVTGSDWGMCCNILHDISIFDALTNFEHLDFSDCTVNSSHVAESKRAGYYEVFGTTLLNICNANFEIECLNQGAFRKSLYAEFINASVQIDFLSELITVQDQKSTLYEAKFPAPRASNSTAITIAQLLKGERRLPRAHRYSSLSKEIYSVFARSLTNIAVPPGILPFS